MYYNISKHAKLRLKERNIDEKYFKSVCLKYTQVRHMIKLTDGKEIRYTKNNLKIVIRDNTVLTVHQVRSQSIKNDLKKYEKMLK